MKVHLLSKLPRAGTEKILGRDGAESDNYTFYTKV